MELTAGQNIAVAAGSVSVRLEKAALAAPDLVALALNDQGRVGADDDFVFYNAPRHPSGGVTLTEQGLALDLRLPPAAVERVVVAADGGGVGQLEGLTVLVTGDDTYTFTPPGLADLPTAVLVEVYRRNGGWRVRAVGQGWAAGLAGLAREYGVNVNAGPDEPETSATRGADVTAVDAELQSLSQRRDALAVLGHEVGDGVLM
ncbi:TerD family protein [Cellulomonas cellasea]|uniref:Stress response protein SCP2 n=1 Tax=Cellulomonas cellasea TaxID=43670 RepID=A0A7W4UKJ0_9CELL|nr:TerD family protein [Cellulomonas cellasea]MBB2925594.1 stress response protein SCP2 [Cellulomonas cellasea]